MQCPRCQHENPAGMKFCGQCAAPLASACPSCGAANPPSNKFCGQCAAPLTKATEPRFESPESYTPKHLAEKILTSRSALEGERKQVTVLFADLKGSMELLADRDPEDARKLLDPVVERMMEAVHHYEGTVNQVMGDGIMALFGAPIGHEDHAVRACYAALRMQRRVNLYADEIQRAGGTPVQIRVGLNSGEVVVRSIGSDLHMDYTAVGQTTHLAARMEQMAKAGSVLVTEATLALAEGYVQVRPLGAVTVKGLETATPVYELLGSGPARSKLQARAARGLTRFVGRASELQQLAQALARAAAGHGQIVAVVGEAGVGKSRLLWEFMRSHRTRGWLILESGSVSYGKATPYLPVIELLKAYFKIQDRDGQREIHERVAGKLLALDRALGPLLTPLLALLDVPVDDAAWEALDPPQRRQRTLEAIKRVLLRESQVQPLLVLFEDLHWIDSETQALLDGLIESLPTSRVLLLVNYRPDYQHSWGSKTYYSQLRLDALPPESAGEFLHALLGGAPDLEPLKQILITQTEGNPFFLEESVRTLVETKALVGQPGAYALAEPLQIPHIPATVQAVLTARIDRLPADEKSLLQSAAMIGKDVDFPLLQAIADLPQEELRRGLGHLRTAEFLYETSLFPDLEYTFKHALTHEVVYQSLLQDRRRALHSRIVEAIEQLYPDRLTEHVDRLAHHAFRAEAWEKAAAYLRQAGTRAIDRSAHREAETCFDQALAALERLPESRDRLEQAVDLRLDLCNPFVVWESRRHLERLREAEEIATSLGDRGRLGWVSNYLAQEFTFAGEHGRAIERAKRALAIAGDFGDRRLHAIASYQTGVAHHALGEYPRAAEVLRGTIACLEGELACERLGLWAFPSVLARGMLGYTLGERGEFAEGIEHGEEAVRTAEAFDHLFSLGVACGWVGSVYLDKGDMRKSVSHLERSAHLGQVGRFPFIFRATSALGYAYALLGRIADALPLLDQCASRDLSETRMYSVPRVYLRTGEAYLVAGRLDEATQMALRARDLAQQRRERGCLAEALRLLGEIAVHQDPPEVESAEVHYRQALVAAEEFGMRPLQAHCHLGLGKLFHRTGDRARAAEHLTIAATMYREMDMGFWLEKAQAELGPPLGTHSKPGLPTDLTA